MKQRGVHSSFLLMFLIFIMIGSRNCAAAIEPSEPHQGNALWIEPSTKLIQTAGEKFNLTVWLNMTEECFAWQLKILFNPTHFNASRVGYTDGEKSDFFSSHEAITVTPIISYSQGYVIAGETLLENDTRSPGYGSLFWIEFSSNSPITEGLFDVSFSEPYGADTFVLSPYLDTVTIENIEGAAISLLQPGSTLVRDLAVAAIICSIVILLIIGVSKRRRAQVDE
ncbi:MAG: hypothetical protein ACFFCP_11125 [Promethearchaeota archaeon]